MGLFPCKHPFDALVVLRAATVRADDEDFNVVVYHFECNRCGAALNHKHAELRYGVDGFIATGRSQ